MKHDIGQLGEVGGSFRIPAESVHRRLIRTSVGSKRRSDQVAERLMTPLALPGSSHDPFTRESDRLAAPGATDEASGLAARGALVRRGTVIDGNRAAAYLERAETTDERNHASPNALNGPHWIMN